MKIKLEQRIEQKQKEAAVFTEGPLQRPRAAGLHNAEAQGLQDPVLQGSQGPNQGHQHVATAC